MAVDVLRPSDGWNKIVIVLVALESSGNIAVDGGSRFSGKLCLSPKCHTVPEVVACRMTN